jgi:hypothetical protein
MSLGSKAPPPVKKPFNINDVDTSVNQESIPVPYGAGVFKATVDWIAPPYNQVSKKVKTSSGKKGAGAASGQTEWRADIAGITNVCADDAPNDAILYVLVNDEIALTGPIARAPGTHYADFSVPKFCPQCRFYWGTKDQPIDTLVLYPRQAAVPTGVNPRDSTTWPRLNSIGAPVSEDFPLPGIPNPRSGHYDFHGAYRNQGLFVAKGWFQGATPNTQTIVLVLARGTAFFSGARFEASETGVNPMGPQFEAFTDDLFGFGFPVGRLVSSTFQACADAFDADGTKLAPVVRNASTGKSFLDSYRQNFDGWLRRNGSSIEAGFFRHGAIDVSALPEVNSDDLTAEPNIKPGDLSSTHNTFFVTYTNRAKWWKEDDTDRYIEQSNFFKIGRQTINRFQRHDIIDGALAVRYATEFGAMEAIEAGNGKASLLRRSVTAKGLKAGALFKSDIESLSLAFVWRIMGWDRLTLRDGAVNLTIERERSIRPSIFIQLPAPKPTDFVIKPAAIANARIVDLPSRLRDLNSMEIAVLADRPTNDIIGFKIYVSLDNINFDIAGVQHHFASFGKVAVSYPAATPIVDTTVGLQVDLFGVDLDHVATQSDQQRDDFTLLEWCENEIMSAGAKTALGSGRFKIFQLRACYGSLQATHAIDAVCWFVFREHLNPIAHSSFQPGATVYFKLVPFTYGGDYDISLVASIAHVFGNGPFLLSGLELAGQGNNPVFTGRDPKFAWRMFSIAGAEITGPALSLGAWDDQFAQFNLRVRDVTSGAVVWTGSGKVPEYVFDYEQNALSVGGKRRAFHFEVAALARDGRQTPWMNFGAPFNNPQTVNPGGGIVAVDYNSFRGTFAPNPDLDFVGFRIWRSLDPAFTVDPTINWVVGVDHAGVMLVYDSPSPSFVIAQPEASTYYYQSGGYDSFGTDGMSIGPVPALPVTTLTLTPTIPPPPISAGSTSFTTPFDVSVSPPSGITVRYAFNKSVLANSAEWPGGIGSYGTINISQSCTLHWRGYDANGVPTQEGIATFTLVASGSGGTPTCASVSASVVSGSPGYTAISVALACAQSGSTIHYQKNGGALTTYTAPIPLALDVDSIVFHASASGYSDSPADYLDNPRSGGA